MLRVVSTCFLGFWLVFHSCAANQEPACFLTQLLTMTTTHKFPSQAMLRKSSSNRRHMSRDSWNIASRTRSKLSQDDRKNGSSKKKSRIVIGTRRGRSDIFCVKFGGFFCKEIGGFFVKILADFSERDCRIFCWLFKDFHRLQAGIKLIGTSDRIRVQIEAGKILEKNISIVEYPRGDWLM